MDDNISIDTFSFTTGSLSEITRLLTTIIVAKEKTHIVLPCSLHDLAQAAKNKQIARAYRQVDMFLPDGIPIVWAIRARGTKTERIYGPDVMRELLKTPQVQQVRHTFYGSSPQTLQELSSFARESGCRRTPVTISPPYRELTAEEEKMYVSRIQRSQPDCLWIGLSSPKQVLTAARWKRYFPKTTILCVGAAFDIITGSTPQAPQWIQHAGLEWAFRLYIEPKRLWKRYLLEIPRYLFKRYMKP